MGLGLGLLGGETSFHTHMHARQGCHAWGLMRVVRDLVLRLRLGELGLALGLGLEAWLGFGLGAWFENYNFGGYG